MIRPLFAAGIGAALLALIAAGPALLSNEPTSFVHRDTLDRAGLQGFDYLGHEARFLLSRSPQLDPAAEALLVLAPDVGYSDDEVRAIREFVYAGGRLLVAGDRGAGKDMLDRLDAGVALTGIGLYTPAFERTPDRMIAASTGRLPSLPAEVIFARPVSVAGGEPLLLAPEPSWEDTNDNGKPDLEESVVRASVASVGAYGAGVVLVVGDRLLFDRGEASVQGALVDEMATGGRTLVLDEAHRTVADPFGLTPLLSGAMGLVAATVILMLGVGLGAFAVLRPRLVRRRAPARRLVRPPHPPQVVSDVLSELETR